MLVSCSWGYAMGSCMMLQYRIGFCCSNIHLDAPHSCVESRAQSVFQSSTVTKTCTIFIPAVAQSYPYLSQLQATPVKVCFMTLLALNIYHGAAVFIMVERGLRSFHLWSLQWECGLWNGFLGGISLKRLIWNTTFFCFLLYLGLCGSITG